MYIYVYIYRERYTHTHRYIDIYIYIYMHRHKHIYIYIYAHTSLRSSSARRMAAPERSNGQRILDRKPLRRFKHVLLGTYEYIVRCEIAAAPAST